MLLQELGPHGSIRFTHDAQILGVWYPDGRAFYFPAFTPEGPKVPVGRYGTNVTAAAIAVEAAYVAATGNLPGEDDGFERWMARVDAYLERYYGVPSHLDLPDWSWRDAYDAGRRVPSACEAAMEAAAWF